MSLNYLRDGSPIKITVMVKGEPVEFKLAVVKQKNNLREIYEHHFSYINDELKLWDGVHGYADGIMSGSIRPWNNGEDDFYTDRNLGEVVTTNFNKIQNLIVEDIKRIKCEKENYDKKQYEKAERINYLQTEFNFNDDENDPINSCFSFERTFAEYDPSYSRHISGGKIYVKLHLKNGNTVRFSTKEYINRDGRISAKKFKDNMENVVEYPIIFKNSKELVQKLSERYKELSEMINNI